MDTLYINRLPFSYHFQAPILLHHWACTNRDSSTYRSVIDKIFRLYNAAGFYVKKIHYDIKFKKLMEPLKDNLEINVPAQQYVKQAEQNNCVIKE